MISLQVGVTHTCENKIMGNEVIQTQKLKVGFFGAELEVELGLHDSMERLHSAICGSWQQNGKLEPQRSTS